MDRARVLARAAREVGLAAAFAADDGGELLQELAGVEATDELRRHGDRQVHAAATAAFLGHARQHRHPFELARF